MVDDDDDEINPYPTSGGGRSPFDMDEAFCARMRAAIEAGLRMHRLALSPRLEPKIPNTSQQSIPGR
jgi:hypothetical protein